MKLTLKALHSRVSRRIVLLFFLAALVPVVLLSSLAYVQISDELERQGGRRMQSLAKELGMEVIRRLDDLRDALRQGPPSPAEGAPALRWPTEALPGRGAGGAGGAGPSLLEIGEGGAVERLGGPAPARPDALRAALGRIALRRSPAMVFSEEAGGPVPYLLVPLPGPTHRWLALRTELARLLDLEQVRDRGELVCILRGDGGPFYCNRTAPGGWLQEVQRAAGRQEAGHLIASSRDGDELLTGYWTLSLASRFQAENLIFSAALPMTDALAPTHRFEAIFPKAAALAICLVVLFSIPLIRSNLKPLEQLRSATRRIAAGAFDSRVTLQTRDEFQELGDSFNAMAEQLGQQFAEQRLLGRLGQALQEARSLDDCLGEVCRELLGHLPGRRWVILSRTSGHEAAPLRCCMGDPVSPGVRTRLLQGSATDLPERTTELLSDHPELGGVLGGEAHRARLLPARHGGRMLAVLVVEPAASRHLALLSRVAELLGAALDNLFLNQRLYHQANHDHLTGLPNRACLHRRIEGILREIDTTKEWLGLMVVDVNNLKTINDTLGHAAGDQLLVETVERLVAGLGPDDILGRFAGDEFVAILRHLDPARARGQVTERWEVMHAAFQRPFLLAGRRLYNGCSMGIAFYPEQGDDFAGLLARADMAMYADKKAGKGQTGVFYTEELQQRLSSRMELEQALIPAIPDELLLHYQPIVDIARRAVVGVEALVRWQRPGHGLVPPGLFIGIAEETGLIDRIGSWVLHRACADCRRWLADGTGPGYVSVNVSANQLRRRDFVEEILQALERSGLGAEHLRLEVTETAVIDNPQTAIDHLQLLRAQGIRILLDDFGTGFASLEYLKSLPADCLKIDRLFIKELPESRGDLAITTAITTLANRLGLAIIAEGVETEAQLEVIQGLGIAWVQGYHFARPMPYESLIDFQLPPSPRHPALVDASPAHSPG